MSKGSSRRPGDEQKYKDNYDDIFGKKSAPVKENTDGKK